MEDHGLENHFQEATEWCDEMGAAEVSEIEEYCDDFCEALQIDMARLTLSEPHSDVKVPQAMMVPTQFLRQQQRAQKQQQPGLELSIKITFLGRFFTHFMHNSINFIKFL